MRKLVLFMLILLLLSGCLRSLDSTALPAGSQVASSPLASPAAGTQASPTSPPEPTQTPTHTKTITPTQTPDPDSPPANLEDLKTWLEEAWNAGDPADLVQVKLEEAGLLSAELYSIYRGEGETGTFSAWTALDMDGDSRQEWLFSVVSGLDGCGLPVGSLWLVGAPGLLEWESSDQSFGVPLVVEQADFSGDGYPEAMVFASNCPLHTLEHAFFVFSLQEGKFISLVSMENDLFRAAKPLRGAASLETDNWPGPAIIITQPSYEVMDVTGDGLLDLVLNGGGYGSSAAGEVRSRSETWGWDGQAVSMQAIWWQPSGQRFDALYDANLALELGDLSGAEALYLQVLQGESLLDGVGFADPKDNRAVARQFAALRLEVIGMLRGSLSAAQHYRNLLAAEYPEAPLAQAANLLLENWRASADLQAACQAAIGLLESFEHPTGSLEDAGYGNPSLGAGEICPSSGFP